MKTTDTGLFKSQKRSKQEANREQRLSIKQTHLLGDIAEIQKRVALMGYYNILILTPKDHTRHDYRSESVYFGESENMMRVKFLEAVRKAQASQSAEYVVIWHDMEQMVRVKIEH